MTTAIQNPAVIRDLMDASKGATTLRVKSTHAALLASKELDSTLPVKERVEFIIALYKSIFDKCDKSVKEYFTNALWILATPTLAIETTKAHGKVNAIMQSAQDVIVAVAEGQKGAVNKHIVQTIAKELRAEGGAGRKVKAKAPKVIAPISAQSAFYTQLDINLKDIAALDAIKRILRAAGYELTAIKKTTVKVPTVNALLPTLAIARQHVTIAA